MSLIIENKPINYKNNPWGYQQSYGYDDICIHNTANNASADDEWAYMNKMQTSGHATVHYFVDETKAIKCMPLSVDAWAVSDGSGKGGNTTDIHIEICRSTSSNATYQKAFNNAMELIAIICKDLGWSPEGRIKFHTDYGTKYCPHKSLDDYNGDANKLRNHVVSEVNKRRSMYKPTFKKICDLTSKYPEDNKNWYYIEITKKRFIYKANGEKDSAVLNVGDKVVCYYGGKLPNGDKLHYFKSKNGKLYRYISEEYQG